MRQVKRSMEIALRDFLESEIPVLPLVLPVTDNIDITVNTSQPQNGRVFRPALSIDDNAGGFVIKNYTENLIHCICEKATKVRDYLANYQQWLLFLVDHMGWGLNEEETQDLVASISDIGVFDGVFIISADGVTLLASISR